MSKSLTLRPRISEKAYGLSQQRNTYVFTVPNDTNRLLVAQAVAAQFNVTVESVRITNVKGKVKQSYRKRSRPVSGKRTDIKRAYVRLKAGDTLPFFAQEEAEEMAEKKTNKTVQEKK
jgi:large subunit ribosomal protein L23